MRLAVIARGPAPATSWSESHRVLGLPSSSVVRRLDRTRGRTVSVSSEVNVVLAPRVCMKAGRDGRSLVVNVGSSDDPLNET